MTSGLLEISWGRRMSFRAYSSARSFMRSAASGERAKDVAEASVILPESSRSTMPSWMTSV